MAFDESVAPEVSYHSGPVDLFQSDGEIAPAASGQVGDFVSSYFHVPFGASLLHSEGGLHSDVWCKL